MSAGGRYVTLDSLFVSDRRGISSMHLVSRDGGCSARGATAAVN
jgi:hypothetical protein